MENVPDIVNYAGHNVPEEMCDALSERGYICGYTLLNAAFYGVPQLRKRVFLIGYHREIAPESIVFPSPTHYVDLPRGYDELLRFLRNKGTFAHPRYLEPTLPDASMPDAVAAEEAIGDLPTIYAQLAGKPEPGRRRFATRVEYRSDVVTCSPKTGS